MREHNMTRILVIDDEAAIRDEIVDWLNSEGYEALAVTESPEGVEYVLRNPADLIISDATIPLLDSSGVWLEVHAHLAATQIPLLFMTDESNHEIIRNGLGLAPDLYINKPFTRPEFLQIVQTCLEKTAWQMHKLQRDIEKMRAVLAEEREQRLLKAKMVAMFSHDFRNPLTVILATSQLLRTYGGGIEEPHRVVHMKRIEAAGRQLLEMLDDMLIIAQMDAGKLDSSPEPLLIAQFLERIVEEFQLLHGATHRIRFESNFTGPVLADPRLLRQITANLISNAIKYSPLGGEVRIGLDRDEKGQFVLNVHDEGIGIPEADQPRLFDAFQRGSNVSNLAGTGLGLAIVKQAVELHGGSIHLVSQNGQGTTISVAIPC
jgi:two-component system, sensor histidine kinase and response regulator